MFNPTDWYLLYDGTDPKNPLLVVVRTCVSRPADAVLDGSVPDERGTPHESTGGTGWLAKVGIAAFAWLARVFGRTTGLRIPQRGQECSAVPISHNIPYGWHIDAGKPAAVSNDGELMLGGDYEAGWTDDGTTYSYWDDSWDTEHDGRP